MPSNPMQDCPNCGSRTADTKLYRFGYCVHCSVCGFNGPTKDSAADAMDEWNNLPAYDGSDALDTWMELRRKATTPAPADNEQSQMIKMLALRKELDPDAPDAIVLPADSASSKCEHGVLWSMECIACPPQEYEAAARSAEKE